jgi:hypothetical protein
MDQAVTLSDSDKGRPVVKVIEDAIYVILHANIVPYRAAAEHVLAELRRLPVEQRAEAVGLVQHPYMTDGGIELWWEWNGR